MGKETIVRPKFYLDEIWPEGWGNMDYPPYLVIKKRIWWIFDKTIINFGVLGCVNDSYWYQTAERMCHLMNILCLKKDNHERN